jgi:alkylated DNA nucleotide flippase Atl1
LEKDRNGKGPLPQIVAIAGRSAKFLGSGVLLIPRPLDVDAIVRQVKKGKLVTMTQIREKLAADFNALPAAARRQARHDKARGGAAANRATIACPLCTGIFLRIAAEVAEEDQRAGKRQVTPYWRVIRDDGSLNDKFPGGSRIQAARLVAEGHRVESAKGKKPPKVREFEKRLAKL